MKKHCFSRRPLLSVLLFMVMLFALSFTSAAMPADNPEWGKNVSADKNSGRPKAAVSSRAWRKIDGRCYNGSGELIPGAITRGIDVSEWQGSIDWKKVKNSDVDFAFIRTSSSISRPDKYFVQNIKNATANGIPVGVYIYSKATTKAEAQKEAEYVISVISGYKISYPVVYDMEDNSQTSMTVAARTDLVIAFCEEIKKAGYYPMVYTNLDWYRNRLDMSRLKAYDVWLASFGDTINRPDTSAYRYSIWQSTGGDTVPGMNPTRGLIDGIPANLNTDVDFGFVDYTKKITPRTAPLPGYSSRSNGWAEEKGQTYYYVNGEKVKGMKTIGSDHYFFSSTDGHLLKNTLLYNASSKNTVYCGTKGILAKNKWIYRKGKKYYFGSDCYAYKGSHNVGGKFYWFDTARGCMLRHSKVLTSAGDLYYYGSDGVRVTSGLTRITEKGKKNTYYFNKDGKAAKGWKTISGKLYYFYPGKSDKTGIRAENTTIRIGNENCTFDKNGVCTKRTALK